MQREYVLDYRGAEAARSRRLLQRTLYGGGRMGVAWAIIIPVVAYLAFAGHAYLTLWLGDITAPVIIGAGVVVLAYIRLAAPWLNRRRFAKLSGVASLEGREVRYVFEDEGFRIFTEHFEAFQRWAGVDRVIARDGMIMIVLGPNANFLPARLFPSNEARRAFIAWLLQKLSPEARARSVIG
ncbi:MAG: YcxB family protein [Alphaproteobacteria bacterium]|nr:MAG: YcxB family protein [Alphaproteobacteria bacterium]